jgi:phospholipid-transporting ATPase
MTNFIRKLGLAAKRVVSTRGGEDSRHVKINSQQNIKYVSNAIATGKYNIFTFVPLFLFSQFKRAANVFFLVISILQQVPNVSPTGQWTTLGPLMIILSISALREIAEDYRRQRDDDQTNNDIRLGFPHLKFSW